MKLTLVNSGRILSHDVLSHPFADVAVSGSYRDLLDRPALTRFAVTGRAVDLDRDERAMINPVLARGSVVCESDFAIVHHDIGTLDYVFVATVVGSGGRVWVDSKTVNTTVVKVADKPSDDETVTIDWVALAR